MEDITWKDILFLIIFIIVGFMAFSYMNHKYVENYREVIAAAKVINAQNQNK